MLERDFGINALWAKKSFHEGMMSWLPLTTHMKDSAAVAQRLWNKWLSEGARKAIVDGVGGEDCAEQLVIFLAAIHDLGKATPVFQAKMARPQCHELDARVDERMRLAGLPNRSFREFSHAGKTPHALATHLLLERAGCNKNVAAILGSHHGKPPSTTSLNQGSVEAYGFNYHLEGEAKASWKQVQQSVVELALEMAGFPSLEALPRPTMAAQVLLSGLLVMTDWIASNEEYFPYISIDDSGVAMDEKRRIADAWETLSLSKPWVVEETQHISDLCQERFGFDANGFQQVTMETLRDVEQPGIVVMEAPMGKGKTEAALVCAEIFADTTGRNGIFFALPTQATSDGIFPRLAAWAKKLDTEEHTINLSHGKAQFNETFQALRSFEGSTHIGMDEEGGVYVHEWFEGSKKALLADFVVGTIDQLLMAALRQKHLMLRHLGLAGKVVIIDECHAYDAYMSQYLNRALNWLGAYGVPVIVLSATLPADKRRSVIEAYLGRDFLPKKQIDPLASLQVVEEATPAWVKSQEYPLITYTDGTEIKQTTVSNDNDERTVKLGQVLEDNLAPLLKELLSEGGCAGVLVNTVKRAQETARTLREAFGDDVVKLLHSRFLAPDRAKKEQELLNELGKPGGKTPRPPLRIVVGTQVLEQSLDIDFDVMVTDLCPMDLLLQRMGRLHRHTRTRPDKMKEAKCYIIESAEKDFHPASEKIYGGYLLMRTKVLLPPQVTLPTDIPTLVQGVYEDGNGLGVEDQREYKKFKKAWFDLMDKKKEKADQYKIGPMKRNEKANLEGWLDRDKQGTDVSNQRAEAAVRDTDESMEVLLVQQRSNKRVHFLPWVEEGREIIIHEPPDDVTAKLLACQRIRIPGVLCNYGRIDKTIKELENSNRELLSQWQQAGWLKGELFLVLDESMTAILNGYRLRYSQLEGLHYEKEEDMNV